MHRTGLCCLMVAMLVVLPPSWCGAESPRTPGRKSDSTGVTASNWTLRPAGRLVPVGDAPQGCLLSPDGRWLAVCNCGQGLQSVQLIDTTTFTVAATVPIHRGQSVFHGLSFSPDGSKLYVAGGPSDVVRIIDVANPSEATCQTIILRNKPAQPVTVNPEDFAGKVTLPDPVGKGVVLYPSGVTAAPDGQTVWVAETLGGAVAVVDVTAQTVLRRIPVGPYPWEVAFCGGYAYVSLWGAAKIAVIDLATGKAVRGIDVGQHPGALLADAAAKRLYVANAHSDTVSIIDTERQQVVGTIGLQPYEKAPPGSTPDALALSADRRTLFVAEAGNNCVAQVALNAERTGGPVSGRIPAAWYPTGVQVARDGRLFVVSMKGLGGGQNAYPRRRYIATFINGLAQMIAPPSPTELSRYDQQVRENNYVASGGQVRDGGAVVAGSPIPRRVGEPSPIKYCVYVIKENRTYDQVFGDLPQGDGDPKLCIYGRRVTTNLHRLAEQYVLLDNFFCDGSVSIDGHQWCKGANVSDAVERSWPLSYSQRGPALGGPVGTPAGGWLWDRAKAVGVSNRLYGSGIKPGQDLKAVEKVLADVKQAEADRSLPRLIVMHLPNDHTLGTRKGAPKPEAMVAENDLAVGRLIEGLSASRFWPEMAVFIVEDDAQDGPDHVDCHRSPALVIGPWVKRKLVDHNFYDQCAVVRTIGLILGLPPLSQFDAAAVPLFSVFADRPEVTAYEAVMPEQRTDEMNLIGAYGQDECDRMNFAEVDVAPWPALNRILWHAAKGAQVPYPGTRDQRWAMSVRPVGDDDD